MLDPSLIAIALTSLGWGAYVPVLFAGIGLVSAVSVVYPNTWPGAAAIHKCALLIGKAAPAKPAA